MSRTMAAIAVAMLLSACGGESFVCGGCARAASFGVIVFSEVPASPVRAVVCVRGGSCYRLRAVSNPGSRARAVLDERARTGR